MITLVFWQKVVLYALLLVAIYIFVKSSQIKINNRPLIKLKHRIMLTLFFPLILLIAFFIGSILLGIVLLILFIGFMISFLKGRKIL